MDVDDGLQLAHRPGEALGDAASDGIGNSLGDDTAAISGTASPIPRTYTADERRKMQPFVSDEEDSDDGASAGGDESVFWSEDESVHGDDLFADADDDAVGAWERLAEDFVREITELGASVVCGVCSY